MMSWMVMVKMPLKQRYEEIIVNNIANENDRSWENTVTVIGKA